MNATVAIPATGVTATSSRSSIRHAEFQPDLHDAEGIATAGWLFPHRKVSNATLIYLAGQVPMDASGTLVGAGDFKAQAEQVFRNIRTALAAAGATPHDIIKLNYYVVASVDATERTAIRAIRDQYVNTAAPPASTLVVVAGLAQPGWLVEIEAVAAIEG